MVLLGCDFCLFKSEISIIDMTKILRFYFICLFLRILVYLTNLINSKTYKLKFKNVFLKITTKCYSFCMGTLSQLKVIVVLF